MREAVRAAFGRLWTRVAAAAAVDVAQVKPFMGIGMLLNDLAAMDAAGVDADWARAGIAGVPPESLLLPAR